MFVTAYKLIILVRKTSVQSNCKAENTISVHQQDHDYYSTIVYYYDHVYYYITIYDYHTYSKSVTVTMFTLARVLVDPL